MKNNKVVSFLLLSFCWATFSFCVATPVSPAGVGQWLAQIFLSAVINLIIAALIINNKQPKPLTCALLLLYIYYLIAKQINLLCAHSRLLHGQSKTVTVLIITTVIIIYLVNFYDSHSAQTALPVFSLIVIMFILIGVLNVKLVNPANIYGQAGPIKINFSNVNIFDYVLPLALILKDKTKVTQKNIMGFIVYSSLFFGFVSVFFGLCIKGNILYSLTPLQALFQITSSGLIERYDYIFTLFIYFGYFAALLILISAYNHVKHCFKKGNALDLLLVLPFIFIEQLVGLKYGFFINIALVICVIVGSEEVKTLEKT